LAPKRTLRRYAKRLIRSGFIGYGKRKLRHYDIRDTIVVSGALRSGTTWLAELLNTIPDSSVLMEPLRLDKVPDARRAGFSWRTFIAPGEHRPQAEAYLDRVLSGQVLNRYTVSRVGSGREPLRTRHWIVKFIRANGLLRWMAERFPTRPPVMLTRHPCAVVSSALRSNWFPDRSHIDIATDWCEGYQAALSTALPHPWLLVAYEHLVRRPHEELPVIFDTLGFALPPAVFGNFDGLSSTAGRRSTLARGLDPVTAWKNDLGDAEIREVLEVVADHGLALYDESPEPNDREFARLSNPMFRS